MRRAPQIAALVCILLLTVAVAAPFFRLNQYREKIHAALEESLQRKVKVGDVRLSVFTGPGVSVSDVEISENPALGAEPIAYVGTLTATPSLWSLWSGKLEFSSLRLSDTQLNVARVQTAPGVVKWNFEPLLRTKLLAAFPNISIRGGRINFKLDNVKSAFYLMNADLGIYPPSTRRDAWHLTFRGEPARTDRTARGFGSFLARGEWRPDGPESGRLNLDLQLEKSEAGDLMTMIRGHEAGIHGIVSGQARLTGPASAIRIDGKLRVEDLHRWDQPPPSGEGWPFTLKGSLNLPGQELEISAKTAGKEPSALAVHYRVAGYLAEPRWGISFNFNRFPLQPLAPIARHIGLEAPDGLQVAGYVEGATGYSSRGTGEVFEGKLGFHDASLTMRNSPPIRFDPAEVLFDNGHAHLAPVEAHAAQADLGRIEADYTFSSSSLDLNLATDGMDVAAVRKNALLAAVPLLSQMQSGSWQGTLGYHWQPEKPVAWSGAMTLSDARISLPAFAEPLLIDSASARLEGLRLSVDRIRANTGDIAVQGDYTYEPGAVRPHQFHLTLGTVTASALEASLMPALRRGNLLTRALNLGNPPAPEWMQNWHADGTVQADSLQLADWTFDRVRSRVVWDGARVSLPDFQARLLNGNVRAAVTADLQDRAPVYTVGSRLTNVDWKGGKLDAEGTIDTSGIGAETRGNMRSDGSFAARLVDIGSPESLPRIAGCYLLTWTGKSPSVRFTELQVTSGGDLYIGQGVIQPDGHLSAELSSRSKQISLTGIFGGALALKRTHDDTLY